MDYSRYVKIAERLLNKYGQNILWANQVVDDNPNPKPWENEQIVSNSYKTKGVISTPKRKGDNFADFNYQGLIPASAIELLFYANDFEPKLGDKVTMNNGEVYEVISLTNIQPGGVSIFFKGLLKK